GGVDGTRPSRVSSSALHATTEPAAPGIGWNSHQAVDKVPDMLCRPDDLNVDSNMRAKFERMCRDAQNSICKAIEELDGGTFKEDAWVREGGGGGISRVMTGGSVFEKAGCSLSVVYGSMPYEALASATERGVDRAKVRINEYITDRESSWRLLFLEVVLF
ncbi:Coproporphyrinogen III oxidase, partial [Pavlovales sp. CCMP2436]